MSVAFPLNLIRCNQGRDAAMALNGTWSLHGRFPDAMEQSWNQLAGARRPFFQSVFLRVLDADPALKRCYLTYELDGRLMAAFVFQHGILDGRQLGDFAPEEQAEAKTPWPPALLRFGRARLQRLRWPLAYLGTPLAPDDPGYAIASDLDAQSRTLLGDAFARIGHHWQDLRADLALAQSGLPEGFAELEAEPEFLLDLPDSWNAFEDYLADLQSKYRVQARKSFKASQSLERRELDVDAIASGEALWTSLYAQVSDRAGFSLAKAGKGHFARMKAQYGADFRFVAWYQGSEVGSIRTTTCIGFHTALVEEDAERKTLHARFIGLDYALAQSCRLYQRMLYDYIDMALERRCKRLDYGRTAAESKSVVGAKAFSTKFAFRYRNRLINPVVGLMAAEARPPKWTERHPFKEEP